MPFNNDFNIKKIFIILIISLLSIQYGGCQNNKLPENLTPVPTKIQTETSQTDVIINEKILKSYKNFGFQCFSKLSAEDKGKNIFISPSGIFLALSMAYNGAEEKTKEDIAKTMNINGTELESLNSENKIIIESLNGMDKEAELSVVNSLWCREDIKFKDDFIKKCKDEYKAEVSNKFNADAINSWVKTGTKGKIDSIVKEIPKDAILYIINAIYFKGMWAEKFDPELTEEKDFFLTDKKKKKVSMMRQSGNYSYLKGNKFQAVSIPYGTGRVSMYIFLPDKNSNIEELEKNITSENWDKWLKEFTQSSGEIEIPKFKIEYDKELNETLKSLGMNIAFDSRKANFRSICELKPEEVLYISKVKHKTFVEVNEEGTEAAAVTSIEMQTAGCAPPSDTFTMTVDHPFFFTIVDNKTGIILFIGSIVEP